MKMNELMKRLIEEKNLEVSACNRGVEPKLAKIIRDGIVEISGCYFLRRLLPEVFDFDYALSQLHDRTGLEAFANQIHIKEYLNKNPIDETYLLQQGLCYASRLHQSLDAQIGFKVILGFSFEPIMDCSVRFYKKRPGEHWLRDDLEAYFDPLLVLE